MREASGQTLPRAQVPRRRPRSVGTKVTDEEYALIAEAAGTLRISQWVRLQLLTAAMSEPTDHLQLAEELALRAIVLTLQFALATGEPLTPETMQQLIERADADKLLKAQQRLARSVGSPA
jgi:hypothetical protein